MALNLKEMGFNDEAKEKYHSAIKIDNMFATAEYQQKIGIPLSNNLEILYIIFFIL